MFAVLHLADFALHAVLRTEKAIGQLPAALFSGTGKKSVAIAANAVARAAGVELGMTAPQAVARCAKLVIRTPQPTAEAEARAVMVAVGFTLSPSIENTAPGVCTVDLKGIERHELTPRLQTAVDELTRSGLPATAGIASTPLLALYAARALTAPAPDPNRALTHHRTSDRFASSSEKTAASKNKITITNPSKRTLPSVLLVSDAPRFLAPLPLSAADPSLELSAVLASWGIRTLGEVTALPRDEMVRRFGAEGLALWQRASGGATRPLHTLVPAPTFQAEMEFEHALETLEPLLFLLRRLLERLTLELQAAQSVAAQLELALRLEDETRHTVAFRLPEPTADVEILFRTLHTHLESVHTATSIVAVQLHLTPTRPLVRQQGLFETGLRDPHGFGETLARVSAVVGADCVGAIQFENTHRPDAQKLVPPPAVVPPPVEPAVHAPLGLPLRRFRPPLPARLEFTAGRATYLWTEHVHGEIAAQHGPWPRSGDWWQSDRAWARHEWDVALVDGGLYRLLRVGEAYFLEGEYD